MNFRFVLLMLFATLPALSTRANDECSLVLQQLLRDATVTEESLLASWADHPIKKVTPVGDAGNVFLVENAKGGKYVFRFQSKRTDVAREAFAVTFARRSPIKTFPQVVPFAPDQVKSLKSILSTRVDDFRRGFIQRADHASISVFYDADLGSTYLQKFRPQSEMEVFFSNSLMTHVSSENLIATQKSFVKAWSASSPEEIMATVHDAKLIFNLKNETADEVYAYLYKNMSQDLLETIEAARFKRIPQAVRNQLADSWILYNSLGIHDFYHKNWLIKNGTVLPIDLGFPRELNVAFKPSQVYHPYSFTNTSPQIAGMLYADVTPEMAAYLKSITPEDLMAMAKTSGYSITNEEVKFILERTQSVLKAVGK